VKRKAIILLSGGLDSATCLYIAKKEGYDCLCLFFDYGQRHKVEEEYAARLARRAGAELLTVKLELPWKGSSLLDGTIGLPSGRSIDDIGKGIPSTYVPGRNTIFLSMAVSYAEASGAEAVFIGAHSGDSSGYPDCRRGYLEAFDRVIKAGTKAGLEGSLALRFPLIDMDKGRIIKLGASLGVPFGLTWSCYEGGERPCERCDSCILRAKGFAAASMKDPLMSGAEAEIADIFSSVQGEGTMLGSRQIFIRFKDCNMRCVFCDEPRGAVSPAYSPQALMDKVELLEKSEGAHHSVSITGGEPLCYADFLEKFLPLLRKKGIKVYLETNGTMPEELERIIDYVDIVAMDIKLPSSTLEKAMWGEHAGFLKIAAKKKAFVKVVVTRDTTEEDVARAARLVKEAGEDIPLIIQPASPAQKAHPPEIAAVNRFMRIGLENRLKNVSVIPQMHKEWGVK
jgi:7-cyano-7-deazaguanine synthase